jgi:hypothetical protein
MSVSAASLGRVAARFREQVHIVGHFRQEPVCSDQEGFASMARSPTYPQDAAVGKPVGKSDADDKAAAKSSEAPAEDAGSESNEPWLNRGLVTGAAIGIGSAALVAALLYANRTRKTERKPSIQIEPTD